MMMLFPVPLALLILYSHICWITLSSGVLSYFNRYQIPLSNSRGILAQQHDDSLKALSALYGTQNYIATLKTSVLVPECPQRQLLSGYTPIVQSFFCISVPSLQLQNHPNWQNRNVTNEPYDMSHINYLYGRAAEILQDTQVQSPLQGHVQRNQVDTYNLSFTTCSEICSPNFWISQIKSKNCLVLKLLPQCCLS